MGACLLTSVEGYAKIAGCPLTFAKGYAQMVGYPLTFVEGYGSTGRFPLTFVRGYVLQILYFQAYSCQKNGRGKRKKQITTQNTASTTN